MKQNDPISVSHFSFPAETDTNVSFVFVSDLHCYDNDPILEQVEQLQPDAVLVGGDFIQDNTKCKEGFEFLQRSASHYPTFCSIGNHELRYEDNLNAAIASTGATVLDNTAALFRGIAIGGLTSALQEQHNLRALTQKQVPQLNWLKRFSAYDGYKILLCHHPEYYEKYLRELPIDLILSGHAHGGHWRIFHRALYAPGQGVLPKYTAGVHENRLIVSRGIGNAFLIPRLNNPPEIVSIELTGGHK